jgi:hypothetical protein
MSSGGLPVSEKVTGVSSQENMMGVLAERFEPLRGERNASAEAPGTAPNTRKEQTRREQTSTNKQLLVVRNKVRSSVHSEIQREVRREV